MRHSFASQCLKRGIHPKIVQELLGDSTIQIVLDLYSHVIQPLKFDAIQLWNDYLLDEDEINDELKKEGENCDEETVD